jgi:ferredoxin hydrogenase large subunit/hydrogenase large subunit
MTTLSISPLTRIEGHLAVHAKTEPITGSQAHKVSEAECHGEMFRGLENILSGRSPMDAQQITQRICGVCPISHAIASIRAQEMAYGMQPNNNGRLLQNLVMAADILQSHVLHFYMLAALDFVDVKAILSYKGDQQTLLALRDWVEQAVASQQAFPAAPFLPRYEVEYAKTPEVNFELLAHYTEALEIRRLCHEMAAVFGAKQPHSTALVPGGCTQVPTMDRVISYRSRLKKVMDFVNRVYLPDLLSVAREFPQYWDLGRGCGNYLVFGAFEMNAEGEKFIRPGVLIDGKWEAMDEGKITEDVGSSRFDQPSGLHPRVGVTEPSPKKAAAYSWLKAPRYRGYPLEVGPLARVMVNYLEPGQSRVRQEVDAFLAKTGAQLEKLPSVLGRHVARGLESQWIGAQTFKWLNELEIDGVPAADFEIPSSGSGYGLTEAARGALGHWIEIENYRIKRYQCVVPTTWNCSPCDDRGQPGPVELALLDTEVADPTQPIEVARIVRSFDPCLACAVH